MVIDRVRRSTVVAAPGTRQNPSVVRAGAIPPDSGTTSINKPLSSVLPPPVYDGS
jgi:hypothetical protein